VLPNGMTRKDFLAAAFAAGITPVTGMTQATFAQSVPTSSLTYDLD
jgi:hypothetical protein